jgi:hypothetical protein
MTPYYQYKFAIMVGALLLRSGLRVASLRSSSVSQSRRITISPICAQGVEKKITQEGTGAQPQKGQKVRCFELLFRQPVDVCGF